MSEQPPPTSDLPSRGRRPKGPPRKSHKKTKNGCLTCRRRHIRCDAAWPNCEQCRYHGCPCDYGGYKPADAGNAEGARLEEAKTVTDIVTSEGQGVESSPGLQVDDEFVQSAMLRSDSSSSDEDLVVVLPRGEGPLSSAVSFTNLPVNNQRLLHHISNIATRVEMSGNSSFYIYLKWLPVLTTVSFSYDYVMDALLSWSAAHLANTTNDPRAIEACHQLRGAAFKKLQNALSNFSERNSDAILSASILLSWLASTPEEFMTMNKGITTVTKTMIPYATNSILGSFIVSQTPFTPQMLPPATANPYAILTTMEENEAITYMQKSLRRAKAYVSGSPREDQVLTYLIDYVAAIESTIFDRGGRRRFQLVLDLRSKLFWFPTLFLHNNNYDPGAMITLAHMYAVALMSQIFFFGNIGVGQFRSLSETTIRTFYADLMNLKASSGVAPGSSTAPWNWEHGPRASSMDWDEIEALMEFPMQTVEFFHNQAGTTKSEFLPSANLIGV